MVPGKKKTVQNIVDFTITPYHAKYYAYELTKRNSSDSIQKLASVLLDAQVDLNPHQVEAALFAFHSPLSKGAILADEVGLGKTIEAGIVISQKWAERNRKILIIVPSNLRKQWNQELQEKFFLPSIILESKSFNNSITKRNLNPFEHSEIVICSYQFTRSKSAYIQSVQWDLVVIDEAHRLRNVYKPSNKIANAIKESLYHAPKILLTATPLQNSLLELFGLVSIIDEYIFGDLKSFKAQFSRIGDANKDDFLYSDLKSRISPICIRTLRKQVREYIKYTNRIPIVEEFSPTENEQLLYDLVTAYLQRPKLYALPPSQRKLMTLILRKLLASSTFAIAGTFDSLCKRLEDILVSNSNYSNYEELFSNDYELFEELVDELEEDEDSSSDLEKRILLPEEIEEIKSELSELKDFARLAKSIQKNSKGEKLLTALEKGFEAAVEKGANRKAIIFTESTRTQRYIKTILETNGYKGQVVLYNGSNTDPDSKNIYKNWLELHNNTDRISGSRSADMRAALIDFFREKATVMIATEAAAEGINLQFCSLVVNYDLPWNPQRIEQRIGRCHRYGQNFDVVVVNFLNKANHADLRVYELLRDKFSLFSGVFGASDEVLGSIESGVDFEKRIAQIYLECRTPEQIQTSFDELQCQLEAHINSELQNTRKKLLENFDEEVHEKLRISLLESKYYLSKYENWLWQLTRFFLVNRADFSSSEFSFILFDNPFPKVKIHPGPYRIGKDVNNANVYRIGHPLAERIIAASKLETLPISEVVFHYSNTPIQITIVEDMVGDSGWMQVTIITVFSFETEEHILFTGINESSEPIDEEICKRLFSVPASSGTIIYWPEDIMNRLKEILAYQKQSVLDSIMVRNGKFFDDEFSKLEKWSEDMKLSLEKEIKDIDSELKLRKAEVRKILNLQTKVQEQRNIKALEHRRLEKRKSLFSAQDEIDQKKELLLDEVESRLKQKITEEIMFRIKWSIK